MEKQQTIARAVPVKGVGLFSGEKVRVRFLPAPPNSGVVFVRTDLGEDAPDIPAVTDHLVLRQRRTSLERDGVAVETVEHLLAALAGLQLDNVRVELSAAEAPGGDGSGEYIFAALAEAGVEEQDAPRAVFTLGKPIILDQEGTSIEGRPGGESLKLSYLLDYPETPIGTQFFSLDLTRESFQRELAPARTFVLESEVQTLLEQGLGKGASYENTLVVGPEGVKENELRFPNEFVRHKMLDLVGDLSLVGAALRGHVLAVKSGHHLNAEFARRLRRAYLDTLRLGQEELDVRQIMGVLPHRYPFLLVDRVLQVDGSRFAVGVKNVTINEHFFNGHFPGQPIMPGVLQVEAMAQLAGVLLLQSLGETKKLAVLLSIDRAKFRKRVVPGDQLILEARTVRLRETSGHVRTRASVQGETVAEAEMRFVLTEPEG